MPGPQTPEENAYAGRWVALVRGRIVAQAATREQAFQIARLSRAKEKLELRFMPVMPVTSPLLDAIRAAVPADLPIHLVGGAVRDAVRGASNHDLDFATPDGLKTARLVANQLPSAAFFPLDEGFDTGRVILQNADGSRDTLDFAGYRGQTLDSDLRGRDFTINAIAMDLHTGAILDPLGGIPDIREKRIRACSATSLQDDPVRILRAVRQAASFNFTIDADTRKQMRAAVPLLQRISPERLREELFSMLAGPGPDVAIRALDLLGVLPHLLPELPALKGVEQSAPHVHDVWIHTLAVLRHLESILTALAPAFDEERANADLLTGLLVLRLGRYREQIGAHLSQVTSNRSGQSLLFFAALYHDVCKPQSKTVEESGRIRFLGHDEQGALTATSRGMALHLSNDELDRLKIIIREHMRIHNLASRREAGHEISPKAIYRFFRDTGETGIDLVLLALADTRATYEFGLTQEHWAATLDVCRTLLEGWFEKKDQVVRPPQLVSGNDLITLFKMKPGPEIGKILEAIRENQAGGGLLDRDQALAFARGWLSKTRDTTKGQ